MHLSLEKENPVFVKFEEIRIHLGFTTTKSAILAAMRLFNNSAENESLHTIQKLVANGDLAKSPACSTTTIIGGHIDNTCTDSVSSNVISYNKDTE
jgi:hypothetical protein